MKNQSIESFLTQFVFQFLSHSENFDEVRIEIKADDFKDLDLVVFDQELQFLNPRDKLQISVLIGDNEPVDYYSSNSSESFLSELSQKMQFREEEDILILFTIHKQNIGGRVSIYSYDKFLYFLENLSLYALLMQFNQILIKNQNLIFEHQNLSIQHVTSSIYFINKTESNILGIIDRQININLAKTSCHSNIISELILVPEDFLTIKSDCPRLKKLFNRISVILSVVFLYDIVTIYDNDIEFKLNGYKAVQAKIKFDAIKSDLNDQYAKIYRWVYNSGNFADKLGLARNIISLHLQSENNLTLSGDSYSSLQSTYKVYEQENIKQYIQIRNSISDQLLNFHDRANKIIENFASGFQKSGLALVSFYISAIALNVLSKDKVRQVFTFDSSLLSTGFLCCSAIYFFVCRWELTEEKKRFANNYHDLKRRYTDLLNWQDIQRILNNDNEFIQNLNFINTKLKNYSKMWFSFLLILFSVTWFLYFFDR